MLWMVPSMSGDQTPVRGMSVKARRQAAGTADQFIGLAVRMDDEQHVALAAINAVGTCLPRTVNWVAARPAGNFGVLAVSGSE